MPRLRDINPSEVALVVRGANKRRFSVLKADDELELDPAVADAIQKEADGEAELLKQLADSDVDAARSTVAAFRLLKAHADELPEAVRKAMDAMCDPGDLPDEDEEQQVAKAAAEYDQICKAKYSDKQRAAMAKNGQALPDGSYPIADKEDLENAVHAIGRGRNNSHADIRAHIVKRAKALGATSQLPDDWNVSKEDKDMPNGATAQLVPVKKEDGTWDLSGVPDESRPAFDAFLKEQDAELERIRKERDDERSDLEKKADEALQIAKAEQDKRETAEFIAKAEELGQDVEFGPVLKAISAAVESDTFEKLEAVLKAAHEQAKAAGLYKEIGRSGGAGTAGSAEAELTAKADEIRKADTSLSAEQALEKAYTDNPELFARMREEER